MDASVVPPILTVKADVHVRELWANSRHQLDPRDEFSVHHIKDHAVKLGLFNIPTEIEIRPKMLVGKDVPVTDRAARPARRYRPDLKRPAVRVGFASDDITAHLFGHNDVRRAA